MQGTIHPRQTRSVCVCDQAHRKGGQAGSLDLLVLVVSYGEGRFRASLCTPGPVGEHSLACTVQLKRDGLRGHWGRWHPARAQVGRLGLLGACWSSPDDRGKEGGCREYSGALALPGGLLLLSCASGREHAPVSPVLGMELLTSSP